MSTNLQSAMSQAELMMPPVGIPLKTRTKLQVAKRVFTLAAAGGFPYTGMSYQDWAKKWLTSDTYRLMEIDINAAASPHLPKNPERVAFRLLCGSESMDPIVVDLNKQKTGKSHLGYIPKIVVLDGKHRKQAQMLQGHTRILAWVGCKAEKHLQNKRVINNLDFRNVTPAVGKGVTIQASLLHTTHGQFERSSLNTAYNLHCATVPATGQALLDQSGGEKGSRPKPAFVQAGGKKCPHCGSTKFGLMPSDFETAKCKNCGKTFQVKAGGAGGMGGPGMSNQGGSGSNPLTMRSNKDCHACGTAPFSTGQLEEADESDSSGKVPNPSDQASFVAPSDQRKYLFPKPNMVAPGKKGWVTDPGTLVGSNLAPYLTKSTGATRSEESMKYRSFRQGTGTGPTLPKSTGATRSEMSRLADTVKPAVKAGRVKISKIWQAYKSAVAAGWKPKREMEGKAAPGWESSVKKMKKHADITNPFALSWWMHEKGYTPGGK